MLVSQTGITGATATLATTYEGGVVIEVWAVRDGLESWQQWRHTIAHSNPPTP
ncbi:hypothetical protein D3C78_1463350 [compost metagenome]